MDNPLPSRAFGQAAASLGPNVSAAVAGIADRRAGGPAVQLAGMITARPGGTGLVAHAWVLRRALARGPGCWGAVLGPYPDGSGSGWALSLAALAGGRPDAAELCYQLTAGDGMQVTPSLHLHAARGRAWVSSLGVRAAWQF